MKAENFVHLHVHTCYSELDGLGKIDDYVIKAKELGMKALAITDHGSTSGNFAFYNSCVRNGIKPILGTEFYYETEMGIGHLIALAMNNEGMQNIYRLQHYAYTKGFYKKPCVDIESLKKFNRGIIITSACIANPIARSLVDGKYSDAYDYAVELQDIFGSRFYIEIQSSQDTKQAYANQRLVSLADKIGAEIVLTNDCHYVEKEDAFAHEVLLSIQTKKKMSNPDRFKFDYDDYYFKSIDEIRKNVYVDKKYVERALCNTNIIAELCDVTITKENHMPKFPGTPKHLTEKDYLTKLCHAGIKSKIEPLLSGEDLEKYIKDVEYEIEVIDGEGYSGYHLIVQDYINFCRKNKIIVGDGRGSASGSKVGYLTNIHTINPDKYNLLFERFMSKGREPD